MAEQVRDVTTPDPARVGDQPIGIVSLGDLAKEQDPDSVRGDISAAQPNN